MKVRNALLKVAIATASFGVALPAEAGSPIPGGPSPASPPAARPVPRSSPTDNGGVPAAAQSSGGATSVKVGDYECWAFSSARMLQNFSILDGRRYRDSEGQTYGYRLDGGSQLVFEGGVLSDLGAYHVVYHNPQGRPTASFRNAQNTEVSFCQWVR